MNIFTRFTLIIITVLITTSSNAQDTLTILHLNDTHSSLAAMPPRNSDLTGTQGGIARAASVIGMTKAVEKNVLTLHAGDYSIGEIFFNTYFGVPELQLLKNLGLDAMTVGNHEWDLTPATLLGALEAAFPDPADGFPLLSANTDLSDPSLAGLNNYILPYTVKQIGTIKVGIFGMTTPAANLESQPAPAVISEDIFTVAGGMVNELSSQNCDVIVLLSHLGLDLDKLIAENVPGINLIIGGHDHYLLPAPVQVNNAGGTTLIVQAGSNYLYMGKVKLLVDNGNVSLLSGEIIPLDNNIPEEPSVLAVVNGLIPGIESFYSIPFFTQQAGYAASFFREVETGLVLTGSHDTPLGNLVTDAFRSVTGTDIAMQAGGSLGFPIYAGPFVPADLYRANGYGFNTTNTLGYRLVTFQVYGEALIQGLEFGLSEIEKNDEYFIQCSGMEYTYDSGQPVGSRVTSVIINGVPLNPSSLYSVTSNEALTLFLDYLQIPYTNLNYLPGDITEFLALMQYVGETGPVIYPKELGRVVNLNSVTQKETFQAEGIFFAPEGSYFLHPGYNRQVNISINAENGFSKKSKDDLTITFPSLKEKFISSQVDWLAVEDSYAELKGRGKINNEGDYGFLVQAFNNGKGSKPQVIVWIWNALNEQLVYANFTKTDFSGKLKLSKDAVENAAADNIIPEYSLSQNYPNPFNPTTNLKFSLKLDGKVSLKIYDVLGNEVAVIVNDYLPAGNYSYEWNASSLASGIYIYQLNTDKFTNTKKMLLLK